VKEREIDVILRVVVLDCDSVFDGDSVFESELGMEEIDRLELKIKEDEELGAMLLDVSELVKLDEVIFKVACESEVVAE
jgi:hypothetical protein